jgi:hypothetical protein
MYDFILFTLDGNIRRPTRMCFHYSESNVKYLGKRRRFFFDVGSNQLLVSLMMILNLVALAGFSGCGFLKYSVLFLLASSTSRYAIMAYSVSEVMFPMQLQL